MKLTHSLALLASLAGSAGAADLPRGAKLATWAVLHLTPGGGGGDDPQLPRGAKPSPAGVLSAAPQYSPLGVAPKEFAAVPTRLSAWGNNRYGVCVTSEECFAKVADNPHCFVTEEECVRWAARHGWLNGAYLPEVMDAMATEGIKAEDGRIYKDGPRKAVRWTREGDLEDALYRGRVKIAVAADQIQRSHSPRNGWHGLGWRRDDHTDHCVSLCGYGSAEYLYGKLGVPLPAAVPADEYGYLMFTWGSIGFVNRQSLLAVCREAWWRDPTTAGFAPPPPPEPPAPPQPEPTPVDPPTPDPTVPDCPIPRWACLLIGVAATILAALGVRVARRYRIVAASAILLWCLPAFAAQSSRSAWLPAPPTVGDRVYDPYRADSYKSFRETIIQMGSAGSVGSKEAPLGVLYVGVPDRSVGTYQMHYRVEAGFRGLGSGVYDCWYDPAKCEPVMDRRVQVVAPSPPIDAEAWHWLLCPPTG